MVWGMLLVVALGMIYILIDFYYSSMNSGQVLLQKPPLILGRLRTWWK